MTRRIIATVLPAVVLAAAVLGAGAGGASAQRLPNYPYCLFTGGDLSGFERCNYSTLEQCLFDRRADGGVCYPSPYLPVASPSRPAYTR